MGTIKTCSLGYDRWLGPVYRPGETYSGSVVLEVEGNLEVNKLVVSCHGQALTKWRKLHQKVNESDATGREVYVNEHVCILEGNPTSVLTTGKHTYHFKFTLPSQRLPSSFQGRLGAIAYWVTLEVNKPSPGNNDTYHAFITVLAHLDANNEVYKRSPQKTTVSKALGFGDAGTLSLSASLDRTGYCPGEKILINLEAKNGSSKDLGNVKATLVQHVQYKAGSETDSTITHIKVVRGAMLAKNQTRIWNKQAMDVAAIPPSTKKLTCQIIQVSYHVIIAVEVPTGGDLELKIPIEICTIPLGVSISDQPRLDGSGNFLVDNSRSLNYVPCRAGVQVFSGVVDNFVNVSDFSPRTCFAQNVNPASMTAASGTPKTATPATTKSPAAQETIGTPRSTTAAAKQPSSTTTTTKPAPSETLSKTLQYPTTRAQAVVPSAPPMTAITPSEPPPSYEAACAPSTLNMPIPYYVQPEPGKGSLLLLLFPLVDVHLVSEIFKRQVPNMLLHGGKIILYTPTMKVLPSKDTAAILIHFGAQRTALSWLLNMTSSDSNLTSKWWSLVSENNIDRGPLGDISTFKALRLSLFRKKSDFKATKAFWDEYLRLVKEAVQPAKLRHGGKTIMTGKTVFACGDWSSFPAKACDMTLSTVLFPSIDHITAYRAEYTTEPDLIRVREMSHMAYTIVHLHSLETGSTELFQDC